MQQPLQPGLLLGTPSCWVGLSVMMVDSLALYQDELEVEGAFNWRDSIAERLEPGEQLPPESAALLRRADDQLMRQREMLVRRFASVFDPERKATIPRALW